MPVTLQDLVRLHDTARTCHREKAFDTDQVRWHAANGKGGEWVIMHPEPKDPAVANAQDIFWTWPVMLIEGDMNHLRLLMDNSAKLPDGWQEVANGIHLSYSDQAPALVEHLMAAIYPLPKDGVLDGFDPVTYLQDRARWHRIGGSDPKLFPEVGMALQITANDIFTLHVFAIHGRTPALDNYFNPQFLCQDPFLYDVLLTDGPHWISC